MIKYNSQEYYFYKLDISGLRGGFLTLFTYIRWWGFSDYFDFPTSIYLKKLCMFYAKVDNNQCLKIITKRSKYLTQDLTW